MIFIERVKKEMTTGWSLHVKVSGREDEEEGVRERVRLLCKWTVSVLVYCEQTES